MRILAAICILLCTTPALSEDATRPASITYSLGGAESGPYRVSVDLTTGILSETKYSWDLRGGVVQHAPEPSTTRTLTGDQLKILQDLADTIWEKGVGIEVEVPSCDHCSKAERARAMSQIQFPACSMDAMGRFEIVKAGATKTYDFEMPCINKAASKLLDTLSCDAAPDSRFCKAP